MHLILKTFTPVAQKTIEEAEQRKIEGNKCFAKDAYDDAINLYSEALEILQDVAEANDLKATCHSNKSICFLKMVRKRWPIPTTIT